MDIGLSVGLVTMKHIYITTRKSKSVKLMKKWVVRKKVKCIAKIKINCISLTLKADERGDDIKLSYQIGDSGFRFNATMQAGI
jgi:hypothetical protein